MPPLALAARLVLIVTFALSAWEKWRVVRERRAAWQPVLLATRLRGSTAETVLMLSLLADSTVIATMFLPTSFGALLAVGLLAAYTVAGWPVERAGEDCRCTGDWMVVKSVRMFLARNVVLLILALIAGPMPPLSTTSSAGIVGALAAGAGIAGSIRLSARTQERGGRASLWAQRRPRATAVSLRPDGMPRKEDSWSTK